VKILLAITVLFTFLLPGCTSSEETGNSSNTSGSESQTVSFTAPDKSKAGSGGSDQNSQNSDELKVVFEEDDYPVVFSTDAGNVLKIPQGNSETTVKLLCHDPSLKIDEEIKKRGRSLDLATGQTGDGKRIWAVTRFGGRIWDAASGKELASYYLKFPVSQTPQGSRSPQALGLEVRDKNTLVNRGYIPSLLLSPQANLLVTSKSLHSDSKSKGRISIYDTAAKKVLWTHEAETPGEDFSIVGFTADEQNLIVRKLKQNSLLVFNSRTGKPVTEIKPEAKFEIKATQARFTPAGLVLASTDYNDNYALEVWSTTDWKQQGRIEGQKKKPEKRNGFSLKQPEPTDAELLLPEGWGWICKDVLATTEDNKTLNIWDLNQPRFDPSAGKWTGSQIREWPGSNTYLIEVPPNHRGNALARLGLIPVTRTFDQGATLLAETGDLYQGDNHQYLSNMNLNSVPSNAAEKITISDHSGQHIPIDASLILGPPQKLQRLVMQASSPALETYRVSVQPPRLTGVAPLKFAPPNFIIPEIVFDNQNNQLLEDRHRIFDFVATVRGEIDFAISSNGTIVAPLMADGSQGLFSALVSVPDGNSHLFKLQESTFPGFSADATKIAFLSSNGVSLHHAQNGALEQKVTYNTSGYEPFLAHLLSPDGNRIISVRKTKQGPVWCITNCLTGKHEGDLPVSTRLKSKNGSEIEIRPLALSADNNKVLFFAGQLFVWDIPQQKELPFNPAAMQALQKTTKGILSIKQTQPLKPEEMRQRVQFTPDSQQIAILNDHRLEFWGLDSGQLDKTLNLPHLVTQFQYLPDGKSVLYSSGNQIFICDLTADLPHTALTGTRFPLNHFQVSQNGRYVASVCPILPPFDTGTPKGMLRIWDLQSPKYGATNQESIVIKVSPPQITKSMASAEPRNKTNRPTPAPIPAKPAELSEAQMKQIAAFKSVLKEGQDFSGKWTISKLSGRIALKVVKVKGDDTYEIELYEPGKSSQTKSFEGTFVPDKDQEKLFLELTPVEGSGINRSPSRAPKTYNLLLITDTRNYRFILDKTSLVGMDSQGLNYQLFQQ
tara:strand:- start:5623 stop:8802 length:3180 start_codon:yes stop_codon:yes gene_type:complete